VHNHLPEYLDQALVHPFGVVVRKNNCVGVAWDRLSMYVGASYQQMMSVDSNNRRWKERLWTVQHGELPRSPILSQGLFNMLFISVHLKPAKLIFLVFGCYHCEFVTEFFVSHKPFCIASDQLQVKT
jgi:hypothetical protein